MLVPFVNYRLARIFENCADRNETFRGSDKNLGVENIFTTMSKL
jgi:hypothetical protein